MLVLPNEVRFPWRGASIGRRLSRLTKIPIRGPASATLWKPDSVEFTQGAENIGQLVLPIKDSLPKQRDIRAEMGGSGLLLPE